MDIGDVFMSLRGLAAPLVADAEKAGEAAGAKGGASFSAAFSTSTKKAIGTAIGAIAGATFGAALTGAKELDAATRQLQADTGMTAEEAKLAEKSLAGMYKNNLQGFDAIGAAMAKVHNDLGLVGEEADAATARFLKFSTATGIDAATGVTLLDDVLDNWNLTADRSQEVMDKVIVSHQRWGGNIDANLVTLAKLAPAMTAANFAIDDGIALLGLFGAKGLDSERAAAAFSKALTKVKSPAELKALIRDIQNTKDPFERAAKAADLFGAKAGAQLANALGGVNLDDYTITIEDAAGATERAADVIEGSFGNRFKLFLKGIQGNLAEFGASFGDVALIAAAFGPQLTKAIAAGLGGLAGMLSAQVVGAIVATEAPAVVAATRAGTVTGAALGGSMRAAAIAAFPPLAIAALIAGAVVLIGSKLAESRDAELKKIATDTEEAYAKATVRQIQIQKAAIEEAIRAADAAAAAGHLTGSGVVDRLNLQTQLDVLDQQLAAAEARATTSGQATGATFAEGVGEGIKANAFVVDGALSAALASIADNDEVINHGHASGAEMMLAYSQGITAARQKPLDAFDTLVEMLKHAMTPAQEAARLAGQMTSKALAAGLKSKDPAVRAQAIATSEIAIDRLMQLVREGGPLAKAAMDKLNAGMKSKDPEIRRQATAAKNAVIEELDKMKAPAKTAGEDAGVAAAAGLTSPKVEAAVAGAGVDLGIVFGVAMVRSAADQLRRFMDREHADSPAPETGSGTGVTRTGGGIVGFAKGGRPPLDRVSWVGEEGRELWVPDQPGTILPSDVSRQVVAAGTGGLSLGPFYFQGIGDNVSKPAARRFAQDVIDTVADGLREQDARFLVPGIR